MTTDRTDSGAVRSLARASGRTPTERTLRGNFHAAAEPPRSPDHVAVSGTSLTTYAATRILLAPMEVAALDTTREILPERSVRIFRGLSNFSGELFVSHALLTSDTGNPRSANMCAGRVPARTGRSATVCSRRGRRRTVASLVIVSHCLCVGLLRATTRCCVDPGPASTTSFAAFSPVVTRRVRRRVE